MDGYETARRIRSSKYFKISRMPLIATSYMIEREPILFAQAGYNQSLIKPILREKLFTVLDEVFKGGAKPTSKQVHKKAEAVAKFDTVSFNQTRILVAEDNYPNQKLIKIMLERIGCEATLASNGREAVDKFLATPHYFDLILMDVQMPILDGFGALRAIREQNYQVPIIALTAHAMREHQEECLSAGMDDYISKPVSTDALIATIIKYVKPGKKQAEQ